tara:strand:+ start:626 stop:1684 length:1059 start_codon:yes stop_codon:yes gene_type:complete
MSTRRPVSRPAGGPTRLDHVLRVGAQRAAERAAQRTAPTAGFGDTEPVPRGVMDRTLLLLDRDQLYQYMQRGMRDLRSLSDSQLFQLWLGIPLELLKILLERIDTHFPVSDSTVAMSNFLMRLFEGRYDERGVAIEWDEEEEPFDEDIVTAHVAAIVEAGWPIPPGDHPRVKQFLDDVRHLRVEVVRNTLAQSVYPRQLSKLVFGNGYSVLECALHRHTLELVQLFMEHLTAEDLAYQSPELGRTALMYAASGPLEFVEALFPQAQLSLNAKDNYGATAMDLVGRHRDGDPVHNFLASLGAVNALPPGWDVDDAMNSDDDEDMDMDEEVGVPSTPGPFEMRRWWNSFRGRGA